MIPSPPMRTTWTPASSRKVRKPLVDIVRIGGADRDTVDAERLEGGHERQ